jgi:hypothetical protein
MLNMPSNDDLKHQVDVALQGGAAAVDSGVDEQSVHHVSEVPDHENDVKHQEFTFFQKNKNLSPDVITVDATQVSRIKVQEFVARVDNAVAGNLNTQRHISELMGLMSDIVQDLAPDVVLPNKQTSRRSKWLFYSCLAIFGLGWFFLFPIGQDFLTHIMNFLNW